MKNTVWMRFALVCALAFVMLLTACGPNEEETKLTGEAKKLLFSADDDVECDIGFMHGPLSREQKETMLAAMDAAGERFTDDDMQKMEELIHPGGISFNLIYTKDGAETKVSYNGFVEGYEYFEFPYSEDDTAPGDFYRLKVPEDRVDAMTEIYLHIEANGSDEY